MILGDCLQEIKRRAKYVEKYVFVYENVGLFILNLMNTAQHLMLKSDSPHDVCFMNLNLESRWGRKALLKEVHRFTYYPNTNNTN